MKKLLVILGIALLCLPVMAAADDETPVEKAAVKGDVKADVKADAEKATPEKELTLAEYLIGDWKIEPNKNILSGNIVFWNDGTYIKNEKQIDGAAVGTKGEYKLYPDKKPCWIDICLGECDQEGSEWTTLFGIVRMLDDGRVEILTSPDANRPAEFGDKPDDIYTMILTRKVTDTKK